MLSIIIIHYNTPELLARQLKNLHGFDGEVIVVDNSSIQSLKKAQAPRRLLINNKINQGYAFAANQGAVAAKDDDDYLLFLNPDVTINPELLIVMIQEAQDNDYDACSPLSSTTGYQLPLPTPYSVLKEYTPLKYLLNSNTYGAGGVRGGPPKTASSVSDAIFGGGEQQALPEVIEGDKFSLFGGCLLIKKSAFKKIGGWDEQFFLWFEDADITKRLYDNNFHIGWLSTQVPHKGGVSFDLLESQTKKQIFFHSLIQYARKHWDKNTWWIAYMIAKRYGAGETLPDMTGGVDITVPNLKKNLIDDFLKKNTSILTREATYTVVTSALSPEELLAYKKDYPYIRWIRLETNTGFTTTVNTGMRSSAGKFAGTVNDDVILQSHWIKELISNNPQDTGSLNPIIKNQQGEIESAGITILKKGKALPITSLPKQTFTKVDATNGAAVIYNKSALEKVGLFDESFGSYLEDIDLSLRIQKAGFNNYVNSSSSIVHIGQSTSQTVLNKRKSILDFKNWIRVIIKNWSLLDMIIYFPSILIERGRNISGIIKNYL